MHPAALQAGETKHAAMTHARRCDGQRSALRIPPHPDWRTKARLHVTPFRTRKDKRAAR